MIVDTHQHVFWHHRNDDDLVADMDAHGIDAAWLLTWEIAPDEMHPTYHRVLNPEHRRPDGTHAGIPLSDVIRCRDRHPGRFVPGYCPHPRLGDAPALFEAAVHMHGVQVCGEWKFRMLVDDPRCLLLFRKAGELRCPVVLHLDVPWVMQPDRGEPAYQPDWYGGTVANLERVLLACPYTAFIGHAPGFWREISADADTDPSVFPTGPIRPGGRLERMLDGHANLYVDLSAGSALRALKRDPDYSGRLLTRFCDRFLFGRDYYGGELMAFLDSLSLSAATRRAILADNALRLVPLDAPRRMRPLHGLAPGSSGS